MKQINKKELHELFVGIINKDDLKFNEFYYKYNKLIYGISFSILKNEDECKDITQNVFIKIWNLEKEKFPSKNEASWLYSLTKNEALTYLRNKKQEFNIEDLYYLTSENEELNSIIEKDKFNRIISKLDIKEQEIVTLKILSKFSFNEISKMLGMPIGTVQWKYYKAIDTLKLLITNMCMFIITIGIYLRRKTSIKVEEKVKNGDYISIDENGETKDETVPVKEESQKQQESIENAVSMDNENVIKNIETESIVIQSNNENKKSYKVSTIDIGLIVIASTFLILSIIFFKNFIKHQQNMREKASK